MISRCLATGALLVTTAAFAFGADVPAAAMNKTITISFIATGTATDPDGTTHPFNTGVTRVIYISSAGRLFMRQSTKSVGGADQKNSSGRPSSSYAADFDPGDSRTGKGSFSFRGDKLVGVVPWGNGARQFVATFDNGFSSCRASVIEGNTGSGWFMRMGPGGVVRRITNATATSPTCSIQSGNAFAQ